MIVFIGLGIFCILFGRVARRKKMPNNCLGTSLASNITCKNNKLLDKQNKVTHFFSAHSIFPILLLIFFFTFRAYSVGADTKNYFNYFLELQKSSMNPFIFFSEAASKELGYDIINYVVLLICPNYTFFLFVESLIIFIPLFFIVKRYSIRPEISYFIFIIIGNYAQSFNITRQYICLIMLLLSLKYVFSRSFLKFLLFVFLGFLFHSSSLIFVILYPLYNFKLNKKLIFFLCLATLFAIIMFEPILKIMSILMRHDYYSKYGPTSPHMIRYGIDNLILNLFFILAFIIFYMFRKNVSIYSSKCTFLYDFFLKMLLCFLCIKMLAFFKGDIIERIGLYFSVSLLFIIPIFIESQDKYSKKIVYLLIIIGGIAFMIYVIFIRGAYTVLPYKTIFSCLFK